MWILVIEDDRRLADLLRRGLEAEGFTVDVAVDGVEGENMAQVNAYDAVLVDWRLPRQDGRSLIAGLRENGVLTPAIMLTALADVEHRVAGLDAGADDYLSKPFSFEELLARLRALARRPPLSMHESTMVFASLVVNQDRREVLLAGVRVDLRPKEYAVLEALLRSPGAVVTRSVLAERVWGSALYVSDNVLDVTISGLRNRLRSIPGADVEIETVRGVGYRVRQAQ